MMNEINMLSQPMMRRLFLSDNLRLTDKAERLVLQLHLALGGDISDGEYQGVLHVGRGDIRDWRSFDDAVTYDGVQSREEYLILWDNLFPNVTKAYTFTTHAQDGSITLTITDGVSSVTMSRDIGDYMIPQVAEVLRLVLAEILLAK